MDLITISSDKELLGKIEKVCNSLSIKFTVYGGEKNALEVMSTVCSDSFNTIILDDDFLSNDSPQILAALLKVNKKLKVIFLTSDSSVERGRLICGIGVYYYSIKPVEQSELFEAIQSINKIRNQLIN